jgi:RES domain
MKFGPSSIVGSVGADRVVPEGREDRDPASRIATPPDTSRGQWRNLVRGSAGKPAAYRFDATGGERRVMYAAAAIDGAFAETILHGTSLGADSHRLPESPAAHLVHACSPRLQSAADLA